MYRADFSSYRNDFASIRVSCRVADRLKVNSAWLKQLGWLYRNDLTELNRLEACIDLMTGLSSSRSFVCIMIKST